MNRRTFLRAAAVACTAIACKRTSEQNESKRMPKPPPPPDAEASAELHIVVEIDGKADATIDATKLNATKPDFVDGERRAWRIESLVGASAKRDGTVIAVTGEKGVTVTLHQPKTDKDPLAVLAVSRRGEVVAAMVEPEEPFPPYHGQGGRLGRRGDPLPRVAGVTKIAVSVEPSGGG
jgi:hypothetical protein